MSGAPGPQFIHTSNKLFISTNTAIRNIKDLCIEVKVAGLTHNSSNVYPTMTQSEWHLLMDLNNKIVTPIDRQDFKKQVELSKVIGKEVSVLLKLVS